MKKINLEAIVTVNKPLHEVYTFWHKMENIPLLMKHLKQVRQQCNQTFLWETFIPYSTHTIEFKTQIVTEVPNKLLCWKTLPDQTIEHTGKVLFEDAGILGTTLNISITYQMQNSFSEGRKIPLIIQAFNKLVKKDIINIKHFFESDITVLNS